MTTTEHDAFTDAATAAYEDYVRTPKMNVGTFRDRIAEAYMDAAEWARDHLAAEIRKAQADAWDEGEDAGFLHGRWDEYTINPYITEEDA